MLLSLSPEQEQLRDSVRSYLDNFAPAPGTVDVKSAVSEGNRLAHVLDVVGLAVPEELGGSGAGITELSVVLAELGRVLFPAPYLSTVLALEALLGSRGGPGVDDLIRRIVAGELRATVLGPVLSGSSIVTARPVGNDWVISGHAEHVLDGDSAEVVVVFAVGPDDQLRTFLAGPEEAPGLTRWGREGLDGARGLARVQLTDTLLRPLGRPGAGQALLERVLAVATVVLAAEQLGGAQRCLEVAVEHAQTRVQFGRPIGSFQAVKHRCADIQMAIEAARWPALNAVWAVQEHRSTAPMLASMTKAVASDAFVQAAGSTIQVLGGIGFTWEHPAHRYYRRAVSSRELFGPPDLHREHVAADFLGEDVIAWNP